MTMYMLYSALWEIETANKLFVCSHAPSHFSRPHQHWPTGLRRHQNLPTGQVVHQESWCSDQKVTSEVWGCKIHCLVSRPCVLWWDETRGIPATWHSDLGSLVFCTLVPLLFPRIWDGICSCHSPWYPWACSWGHILLVGISQTEAFIWAPPVLR